MKYLPPPWKIKVIEPIKLLSPENRRQAIKEAGFNTFLLKSEEVFIDLLTDSGTSAMSDRQWAGIMAGDEAYAGSRSFYRLANTAKNIYGFEYIVPAHQGRGAENLISEILVRPGRHVLSNMYFTTSKKHVERLGGIWHDCIVDEAYDTRTDHPFKGNMNLEKVSALLREFGKENMAFIRIEASCNMAGSQPFSFHNLSQLSSLAREFGVPLLMDATRAVENAYSIKTRKPSWRSMSVREILRKMMAFVDVGIISSKKDNLVNIGGLLATHKKDIYEKAKELVVVYEGMPTYGGMAGRDMEAMAIGMEEMVGEDYLEHRVKQVEWFGRILEENRVPIVRPIGTHAVYVDASEFLSHIPVDQYRAQALTASIYEECGVRCMERGAVSAGRDVDGKEHVSKLELVRLTIPRRVYTNDHLGFAAENIAKLYKDRQKIRGLKMIYEPKHLRFFQARFERL